MDMARSERSFWHKFWSRAVIPAAKDTMDDMGYFFEHASSIFLWWIVWAFRWSILTIYHGFIITCFTVVSALAFNMQIGGALLAILLIEQINCLLGGLSNDYQLSFRYNLFFEFLLAFVASFMMVGDESLIITLLGCLIGFHVFHILMWAFLFGFNKAKFEFADIYASLYWPLHRWLGDTCCWCMEEMNAKSSNDILIHLVKCKHFTDSIYHMISEIDEEIDIEIQSSSTWYGMFAGYWNMFIFPICLAQNVFRKLKEKGVIT